MKVVYIVSQSQEELYCLRPLLFIAGSMFSLRPIRTHGPCSATSRKRHILGTRSQSVLDRAHLMTCSVAGITACRLLWIFQMRELSATVLQDQCFPVTLWLRFLGA
jgi:hypothetical protein